MDLGLARDPKAAQGFDPHTPPAPQGARWEHGPRALTKGEGTPRSHATSLWEASGSPASRGPSLPAQTVFASRCLRLLRQDAWTSWDDTLGCRLAAPTTIPASEAALGHRPFRNGRKTVTMPQSCPASLRLRRARTEKDRRDSQRLDAYHSHSAPTPTLVRPSLPASPLSLIRRVTSKSTPTAVSAGLAPAFTPMLTRSLM